MNLKPIELIELALSCIDIRENIFQYYWKDAESKEDPEVKRRYLVAKNARFDYARPSAY